MHTLEICGYALAEEAQEFVGFAIGKLKIKFTCPPLAILEKKQKFTTDFSLKQCSHKVFILTISA